ncbi:hypothetical protein GCK32_021326, partial [Trichostrongylus colubriformis]
PSAQMTYVGCEYKPGGNMLNDYIYEIGDPCTRNEHCKCDNCTCSAEEGLCIRPDSTPMPGDVTSQTQQGRGNRFTLPEFHGWKNSQNSKEESSQPFGFGWRNSDDMKEGSFSRPFDFSWKNSQDLKDFFSQPFGFSSKNSKDLNDDWFSQKLDFSRMNSKNQQHENDVFSLPLFSRMNFHNQGENHKWTSEPHGNGFKWSYSNSWSS